MRTKIILISSILLMAGCAQAQTGIERVLSEIEKNNKSILAQQQYWEAQKLSFKTGLTPDNPKAEFDYMVGSPAGAGNQRDMTITQGFDFPTSYAKRKNVSEERTVQTEYQMNSFRQEVLLQAKLLCLEYVFKSKLQAQLNQRLQNANRLLDATTKKADQGETNVLDLNKIRLLQLEVKNQSKINGTEIKTLQHKLEEMNGGIAIDLAQLDYPITQILPEFEELDSLIESNDPVVKTVKQEQAITKGQVALSKSLALPKLEGGYHQQDILGQRYQGFHVGMTIPLWENKNKVKTQQAMLSYAELQIQEHRTKHYYENKQLYEEYLHWKETFSGYHEILSGGNNESLLGKAFEHGELSMIEYLMEVRYFYAASESYLVSEHKLHESVAMLNKFQL